MKPRSDSSQLELIPFGGKRGRLKCGGPCVVEGLGCGALTEFLPVRSPAAPALSIFEQVEPLGWTSDAGTFMSMAVGLSVLCPECSRKANTP